MISLSADRPVRLIDPTLGIFSSSSICPSSGTFFTWPPVLNAELSIYGFLDFTLANYGEDSRFSVSLVKKVASYSSD